MSSQAANLLHLLDRRRWRNRLENLRAEPGQTLLHAAAILALLAVGLILLGGQRATLEALLEAASAQAWISLGLLLLVAAAWSRRDQRQLLRGWRTDWLAAQPLPPAIRRAYRQYRWTVLAGLQFMALAVALAWLAACPACIAAACLAWLAGSGLGALSAAVAPSWKLRRTRRTVLSPRGVGGVARWQWQRAARALAPRSLAALLLLWLLVPRGPALLFGVALLLSLVGLAASAWTRMLGVFVEGQRWLDAEGVPARRWIGPALVLPALLTAASALLLSAGLASAGLPLPVVGAPVLLAMLAALALLCTAAERRSPRRLAIALPLHATLLLSCLQALPPLLPVVWLLQCAALWRRSLR